MDIQFNTTSGIQKTRATLENNTEVNININESFIVPKEEIEDFNKALLGFVDCMRKYTEKEMSSK